MTGFYRGRRLRKNAAIRSMMKETRLQPEDFVLPIFVVEGEGIQREISSLPGTTIILWISWKTLWNKCSKQGYQAVFCLESQTKRIPVAARQAMKMALYKELSDACGSCGRNCTSLQMCACVNIPAMAIAVF